jgi:AraC-like DNA-binding protein
MKKQILTTEQITSRKGIEDVSRLVKQLEQNPFMEFPDSIDFANSIGISPAQFSELFKLLTGLPPYRFYTYIRLEYAKTLIEKGISIKLIASMFGYSHPIKFIQTFKKYHNGKTPGHFKKAKSEFEHINKILHQHAPDEFASLV